MHEPDVLRSGANGPPERHGSPDVSHSEGLIWRLAAPVLLIVAGVLEPVVKWALGMVRN